MNRLFLIVFLLLILDSCSSPDETISDEVLVDILTDMLIADELLVKYGGSDPNNYRDSLKMRILNRYELVESEFDSIIIDTQKDLRNYHLLQTKVGERLDSLKKVNNQK